MKTAIFLPAKGTSTRVPSKNMKLLDGKPLFLHTLEKLAISGAFDEVWLDTESADVIDHASHVDCRILRRDASLANNATDGNALFLNEVRNTDADIVVQILGTSPFIKIETIQRAISILKEDPSHDGVILVNPQKQYTWTDGRADYDIHKIPNSVDLPATNIETMGLYVMRREAALRLGRRIGDNPYLLACDPTEAVDVNYPDDFELANLIASGKREQDRRLLRNISMHLNGPILSDVMDDLELSEGNVILGMRPNMDKKIFGRAKTLQLRKMEESEDFRGIYDALNSYDTIIPGDVIAVENETPDFAYFGELNANLAIRSGAIGAVIGGKTRDNGPVTRLGFPTFSTGYVARDVRKRAVTGSINKPIRIFGTEVAPGDLMFADSEAVIVIPKQHEKAVMDEVFNRLKTENSILFDIAMGMDVRKIVDDHGAF